MERNNSSLFGYLENYKYIIVTGPQRSGTTIITHMIAYDTKKVALDEINFNHKDMKLIPNILEKEKSCVLQAPQALPWMPIFTNKDTAIIYVKRKHEDIQKSIQTSISPKGNRVSRPFFSSYQAEHLWLRINKLLDNPYVVDYELIKNHPLFVHKSKRVDGWTHKSINTNDKNRKCRVDYSNKIYGEN